MFTPEEMESIPELIVKIFKQLERDVINDILTRMEQSKSIISSTDYQLWMINQLGSHKKKIKELLKNALNLSDQEIDRIYDQVIKQSYVRDKALYDATGADYVPFDENKSLKQLIEGVRKQTKDEFRNITATTGFVINNQVHTNLYKDIMDKTLVEISTGVFDYNKALKRAITDMTASGLRWIDYESGHHNRVDVAVRRAVMTGVHQVTGEIAKQNAEKLETDLYEVSWHSTARPEHQVWQGRVYTMQQLIDVCGLGTGPGLCGWNCYHFYDPFIEGVSVRKYTDEWLDQQNKEANKKKKYGDKEYTTYEATQRQRALETRMRAYKERIDYAKQHNLDKASYQPDLIRYNDTMKEYKDFSEKMGLPFQAERIHTGRSGLNKTVDNKTPFIEDCTEEFIQNSTPGIGSISVDSKSKLNSKEYKTAEALMRDFGGDIKVLNENNVIGIKNPDYLWNDKLWDEKDATSLNSVDKQIRSGIKQIKTNPGGVIVTLNDDSVSFKAIESVAENRMLRYPDFFAVIFYNSKKELIKVIKKRL